MWVCQIKETPSHYLLDCNKFKKKREAFQNNISFNLRKNKVAPQNLTIEELLGEQNFSKGDSKTIRDYQGGN